MNQHLTTREIARRFLLLTLTLITMNTQADNTSTVVFEKPELKPELQALVEFAADVSETNPTLMTELRAALASLSREPEVVGFYLDGDESDTNIAFRTALTLLDKHGYVNGYEDKYLNEMPYLILQNEQFKNKRAISRKALKFIDTVSNADDHNFGSMDKVALDFLSQVEQVANDNGVYYLYANFYSNSGDTDHLIPVNQATFQKWLNIEFENELALTAVQWVLIWDTIATYTYDKTSEHEWQRPTLRSLQSIIKEPLI